MKMRVLWASLLALSVGMASFEAFRQSRESRYVKTIAEGIVNKANARDNRERVIALREYLRQHVTFRGAPEKTRPFLRSSSAEILESGKGYCGEVTRTFIQMADAVEVRAQRINLYGVDNHVVAEAELQPGERVLVDCQSPPQLQDLEPLDRVILRPEYQDYSTLNLRRLHLDWLVKRMKLEMGPLTYWSENPHALQGAMWAALVVVLVAGRLMLIFGKLLTRSVLLRRGWVRSDQMAPLVAPAELAYTPAELPD